MSAKRSSHTQAIDLKSLSIADKLKLYTQIKANPLNKGVLAADDELIYGVEDDNEADIECNGDETNNPSANL